MKKMLQTKINCRILPQKKKYRIFYQNLFVDSSLYKLGKTDVFINSYLPQ